MSDPSLPDRIDALLPQTQCTRCGYPTCRDYAHAIAGGAADINQCPPGGTEGVSALATLLDREDKPLDPTYGVEAPPIVALIDEDICIGCTKCIQACPVDAIVGAAKRMHTVIVDECTGCELCIAPCPVDCIALVPTSDSPLVRAQVLARAAHARMRCDSRKVRLAQSAGRNGHSRTSAKDPAQLFKREETLPAPAETAAASSTAAQVVTAATTASAVVSGELEVRRPIDRAGVLAAIARGKARRAKGADEP